MVYYNRIGFSDNWVVNCLRLRCLALREGSIDILGLVFCLGVLRSLSKVKEVRFRAL